MLLSLTQRVYMFCLIQQNTVGHSYVNYVYLSVIKRHIGVVDEFI